MTNSLEMTTVGRRQVLAGMLAAGTLAGQNFMTSAAAAETPGAIGGKVVLVTGATSGIGAATVAAFASAGAKVALMEDVTHSVKGGGRRSRCGWRRHVSQIGRA